MARSRDHTADYRRRIERGLARGLSRAAARGHAPKLKKAAPSHDAKLEAALLRLRKEKIPLTKLASETHVSRERLSQYIKAVAGAHREGGAWRFNDRRIRQFTIIEGGADQPQTIRARGYEPARLAGLHAYEADQTLQNQDLYPAFIERWTGRGVKDVNGKWRPFAVDLNQIARAINNQDYSFERFYAIPT